MTVDIQTAQEYTNLAPSQLIEESLRREEGTLSDTGALLVTTGKRTGRSPADRYIVREPSTEDSIDWGSVNRPFDGDKFDALWDRVESYLSTRDRFVTQPACRRAQRSLSPRKSHHGNRLAVTLSGAICSSGQLTYNSGRKPEWNILNVASFECDPERDGTNSEGVVIINFRTAQGITRGHALRGRNEKIHVLSTKFPAAREGCHAHALQRQCRREPGDTALSSSVYRAPAKPRCPPTPIAT